MADISVEEAEAMVIEAAKELNEAQQLENTKLEELNAHKFGARLFKRQEYKDYSKAVRERNKAQNNFDELYAELLNTVYDERQTIRKEGLARAKEASERLSKIEDEIKAAESEGNNDRLKELNIELVEAQGELSIANAKVALNQAEYMYTRAKYDKFSIPAAAFEETSRVQGAQRLVEYRQEELQKAEEAAQKTISEARGEDSKVIETEEQIETSVDESSGVLYDRIEAARANVIRFREQVAAIQENMPNNQGPMVGVAQEALEQATNQLIRAENDYKQLTGKDFDDVEKQVSQDEPAATAAEEPSFEEANGGSVEEAQAKVSDANQRLREIRERISIARNEGDSLRLGALNLEYIEARGNLLIANAEKNLVIAKDALAVEQLGPSESSIEIMRAMLDVREAELEFAKAWADNRMKAFRADKLGTEEARNAAIEAGKREDTARSAIYSARLYANRLKSLKERSMAAMETPTAEEPGEPLDTDEPGNTPSSENESQKQEEGPEVPPFMNKNANPPRWRTANNNPETGEAEEQGETLNPDELGEGEEPVSNQGENGQSQTPREMSEQSKEKIAMLANLRRALTQLDVAAQTAIQMVIDRAEVAKNDPNETLKVSDVSALKEVLAKMDEIVYSPEVANAAADASQAYQMNILIGNLRRKIQKNIQKSIVENYHDLNIENDLVYFYNGNNPNDPARNGSSMKVEGFFGDFVKRNLDNSRLRYEEMQLRTMKRGLAYAKIANNPQYEGFEHVFGELNNACVDKANIDLVFQKAAEYTPEKIQSMMDALQTQQFSPEQIKEVFKAVSEYTKALEDIEKSFKENSQLVGEKRKVIEEIINGNNEFDKNANSIGEST